MLTITLLTKNNQKSIGDVLESVNWADEVVVLDGGSTDHTLEIAASFPNVKTYKEPFDGLGKGRQLAASLATHEWIFSLNSDELVSPELAEELQELTKDPSCVYSVPRRNYFNGKWIRTCGWWPDRERRLYHRGHAHFSNHRVGERLLPEGLRAVALSGPLDHYPYTSIAELIDKMQRDSDLYAAQYRHRRKASVWRAVGLCGLAFFKAYILQRGIFSGAEGFVISCHKALTAYYMQLKMRQLKLDLPPTKELYPYDEDI